MTRRRRSKQKRKKNKKKTSKVDYLPAKLIEQILQNLPVKSLLRFSTASNLWNSIIFRPEFAQSYRGRETIVFTSSQRHDSNTKCLACPLSSISSDEATVKTTSFKFPPGSFILASSDYFWCLEFEKSLLLYNPSIRTYRKLPDPASLNRDDLRHDCVHGLGYDSVCDDYKILRIGSMTQYYFTYHNYYENYDAAIETEMYSLRSDCWRGIEPQSQEYFTYFLSSEGIFVSGALHWLVARILSYDRFESMSIEKKRILSFDLSEEKFGLIELPEELELPGKADYWGQRLEIIVFGGKLRVYRSFVSGDESRISVWVMEDYESELWIKETEFDYGHMFWIRYSYLRPFYFYDDVGNLVRALAFYRNRDKMLIYKEENGSQSTPTLVEKNFGSDGRCLELVNSYSYIESFVSPKVDDELMAALGRWRIDK